MDVKRYLNTRMWADTWFENLAVDEKLVWIYLLTNQQTNLIGIYEIGLRRISNETGVEINRLQTVMERFAKDSKAFHNGYFMVIPNALSHQTLANPNMEKSARNLYNNLPLEVKNLLKSLGIADFERLLNGLPNRLQTVGKPFANCSVSEKEKEKEKESEKEGVQGKPSDPDGSRCDLITEDYFEQHRNLVADNFPEPEKKEDRESATNELDRNSVTEPEAELWPTFEDFWDAYDKKREREKSMKKWQKLKHSEKEKIMEYIPRYKEAQPDKQYRKDPATFLNNKSWNDEIIHRKPNTIQTEAIATGEGQVSRVLQRLAASR